MKSTLNHKKILITGAGGFVGSQAMNHFLDRGFLVRAMVRNNKQITITHPNLEVFVGTIESAASVRKATVGMWGVIHTAVKKMDEPDSYATNVSGARNLLKSCQENNVHRIVNISTGATLIKHKGLYGETKSEADRILGQSEHGVTLIPGLIYDSQNRGAFGALVKAAKSPIVPLFGSGTVAFQPVHVDDVVAAIDYVLTHPSIKGTIQLPGPDLVDFHTMIRLLANRAHKRRATPLFVHIPPIIGLWMAKVLALITKNPPFTQSNILGSTQQVILKDKGEWNTFGITPRTINAGLSQDTDTSLTRLSVTAAEAHCLLTYLLAPVSGQPRPIDIEHYISAVTKIPALKEHVLSSFFSNHSILIGPLECIAALLFPTGRLRQKLRIAAMIIECSPVSAEWLLPHQRSRLRFASDTLHLGLRVVGKYFFALFLLPFYPAVRYNAV